MDIVLFMDWGRFVTSIDKEKLPSEFWVQESGMTQNFERNFQKERFHMIFL